MIKCIAFVAHGLHSIYINITCDPNLHSLLSPEVLKVTWILALGVQVPSTTSHKAFLVLSISQRSLCTSGKSPPELVTSIWKTPWLGLRFNSRPVYDLGRPQHLLRCIFKLARQTAPPDTTWVAESGHGWIMGQNQNQHHPLPFFDKQNTAVFHLPPSPTTQKGDRWPRKQYGRPCDRSPLEIDELVFPWGPIDRIDRMSGHKSRWSIYFVQSTWANMSLALRAKFKFKGYPSKPCERTRVHANLVDVLESLDFDPLLSFCVKEKGDSPVERNLTLLWR